MRLIQFAYTCNKCMTSFKAPDTIHEYGEFLMTSSTGEIAYLNAIQDPLFKPFANLLEQTEKIKKSLKARIDLHHKTFGYCCDEAPDGTYYQITNKPLCPICGCKDFKSYGKTNPPEFVEIDLPTVTHNVWNSMSQEQHLKIAELIVENKFEEVEAMLKK